MIQIIGLRPFIAKDGKEKKKHELFTEIESVPWLFKNLDFVIDKIPQDERWNVYFTALDCLDPRTVGGQLRRFKSQEIFPFDIDGIDQSKNQLYIDAFFKVTAFDPTKTVVICSGNGLQFFAQFDQPFTSADYFDQKRLQYKAICERVDKELAELKIPGRADPSVWTPARIMRLPNTINKKPGKADKQAFLISGQLEPQSIDWGKLAGVAEIAEDEHVAWDDTRAPKLDSKEMLKGCNFLKATIENPIEIREPHFYAALSIIGRMENGRQRAHSLHEAIKDSGSDSTVIGYSSQDVEKKVDQALQSSGPRTCKSINAIWGKCSKCPNFGKIVSPVSLKGEEHIATAGTGFHSTNKKGELKPSYSDLLKFFDQKHPHKSLDQNGLPFIFTGTHFEAISKTAILNFAEQHFVPKPTSAMCEEFCKKVMRTNIVPITFFTDGINGHMNFLNGVLNLKTKELLPHGPHWGFRNCLPYAYDPTAKAPRFEQFLDEITDDDKELRAILEEFGGYALSGDEYWIHKTLFLLGDGANGKSIFISSLKEVAGRGNYATVSLKDLSNENNRQLLEGKLFNIAPELSKDSLRDTEKFKYLSDGSEITVKLMWNQPYQIKNRAKMIYACNDIPETDDPGFAFMRRLVIVPFNRTFEGVDADDFIMDKLIPELPGIVNIFIKGYDRLLAQRRFTKSSREAEDKTWYTLEINPVKEMLSQTPTIQVHPLNGKCHFASNIDLKRQFDNWALNTGQLREHERMTMTKFSRLLQKAIPQGRLRRGTTKIEGKDFRGYWDIKIEGGADYDA